MEPITHFLTGACMGRAGLNRKTAYATLTAVLASEFPDVDVIWGVGGPVEELKHHRGITHTFLGAPFEAAVVLGAVWLLDRGWRRWRERKGRTRELKSPLRWGWLYGTALLSIMVHLLLDWTNNYGVRPFYPFNARWYAGSIVFIAEPVLWALLLAALILPALFGLADSEIGARRKPFRGRGWAVFALSGMVMLWCWRWAEQAQARAMLANVQVTADPIRRVALEPYPGNPFRWHAIVETDNYFQMAEINTRTGSIQSDARRDALFKPPTTAAVEAAKRTPLGQVYLDWSSWPLLREVGRQPIPGITPPDPGPNRAWTTVEFSDLRYAYSFLGADRGTGRIPLSGAVYIVDGRDEAGEMLNGQEQK
jgi:inner membrane protein